MNSSSESMVVGGGVLRAGAEAPVFARLPAFFLSLDFSASAVASAALLFRVWGGVVKVSE